MIDYRDYAVVYSISIMYKSKKYIWIANAINYPLAKEVNLKRLKEGTHISRELQKIYDLNKLENNKNDENEFVKFEEIHYELKSLCGEPMFLAHQLVGREHLIKKDLKKYNKDLIILN